MRSLMRECRHRSGDYMEIDIYPVRKISKSRKAKYKPSSETQKKLNQKNAARRLTWLIQENFGTNDYYIGLNYPAEYDVDNAAADKLLKNWLRRIKRKHQKAGFDFKYITTTEIGDKKHRPHHHVICSGELGAKVLRQEWDKQFEAYKKKPSTSFSHAKHLQFTRTGLAGIAFYTCKDPFAIKKDNVWYSFPKTVVEASLDDYKLWAEGSGRSMTGESKGTLIGIFPKLQVKIGRQTAEERALLTSILNQAETIVRAYCVERQQFETASFYFGDVVNKIRKWNKNDISKSVFDSVSFSIIANKRRS